MLNGDAGDDKLHGGEGNDTLNGGSGRDAAVYSFATPEGLQGEIGASDFFGVDVSLLDGTAQRIGGGSTDTLIKIEDVFGSALNDSITGNHSANVLVGDSGNDTIKGLGGDDVLITGSGDNLVNGGKGDDVIVVGAGENTVNGGDDTDTLAFGGDGGAVTVNFKTNTYAGKLEFDQVVWRDTESDEARASDSGLVITPHDIQQTSPLFADDASDAQFPVPDPNVPGNERFEITEVVALQEVSGSFDNIEKVAGGGSTVTLILSDDMDSYDGTASSGDILDFSKFDQDFNYKISTGKTNLSVAKGDDLTGIDGVTGGEGDNELTGDEGDNTLSGKKGADILTGLKGKDTLEGGNGGDELNGGGAKDQLMGQKGKDTLLAGDGNDKLKGGEGKDQLDGGDGNDNLNGGAGDDKLTGGQGEDVFNFEQGGGQDTVTDFEDDVDTLKLKDWDFGSVNEALSFASETNKGHVEFDFGAGDVLVVRNITIDALRDDILI